MLTNEYVVQAAEDFLAQPNALAALSYDGLDATDTISTKLDTFSATVDSVLETWFINDGEILSGSRGDCSWRQSDNFQFVSIEVPCNADDNFERQTELAYEAVLKQITKSQFPHLVRFWNLIPHINRGQGETENYKKFCTGRLNMFEQFSYSDPEFPSASCLGHYRDGIVVYALSSKFSPEHIANPRQINAYSYPKQYGKSSPSFARATSLNANGAQMCFISGTASILGHNTVHEGDLVGQLHTTNDNILYLLKEAGQTNSSVQSLRVFIRHEEDFATTKKMVDEWYPNQQIVYTHADICRADLLVEIECFCSFDTNPPA